MSGANSACSVGNAEVVSDGVNVLVTNSQISNSASIASGSVQAAASDTTPLAGGPPIIDASKTATDVDGGSLLPGDTLLYTLSISNVGSTDTVNASLTDAIPANTTYIPGSTKLNGTIVPDNGSTMPYAAGGLVGAAALLLAWGAFVRLNGFTETLEPESIEHAKEEDEKVE